MSNTTATAKHLVVIPCAAAKGDAPAPARELYASANFAHMLRCAEAHAAETAELFGHDVSVMILSAEHGLLDLDTVVAPYDTKMGDAGSVEANVVALDLELIGAHTVEAMLPRAYYAKLAEAVALVNDTDTDTWVSLYEVYEAAPGIGYQRGVASRLAA